MEVDEKEEEENEDAEDKKPQTSFLSIGGRPSIIPKGFKDVKLQKTTNYFDTILKDPKKQLWLIKLPHEVTALHCCSLIFSGGYRPIRSERDHPGLIFKEQGSILLIYFPSPSLTTTL